MERLVRRYARTHGPFETRALRDRYGARPHAGARAPGARRRPRARRAAPGRHRARVVRPRGAAPAAPRLAGRPARGDRARRPARVRPLPGLAGRASTATRAGGAGIDRLREALVPLQGLALTLEVWERDVLPRRIGALLALVAGPAVRLRRGRLGRRGRARARDRGRVALYFREDAAAARPAAAQPREPPSEPVHELVRARLRAGRVLLHRPADRRRRLSPPRSCRTRCGTSSGPARRPTTPSPRCARRKLTRPRPAWSSARARSAGARSASPPQRRAAAPSRAAGR